MKYYVHHDNAMKLNPKRPTDSNMNQSIVKVATNNTAQNECFKLCDY